ncbi:hypothetical protein NHX12_033788 [Muraenolepis orangiensis]|uniref:Centrosomin N-terminal motif 1 domain-containing protein n=1 Tax=Muraenolepis orangiensis TaxID=630683 RepID=A0A9Q0E4D7_9TELE|nr:hypothetical protein NHX12_033788 [Muraenolepis orangiensis]
MSNDGFRGYRTISQHLNDLKKENFSLKLRIYFLEEKIQQKYEDSSDDVLKRDIALKVEVESLKKDVEDKQQLLDKALSTEAELARGEAERMTSLVDSESQRCLDLEMEMAVKTEECRGLLLQCRQQGSAPRDG